MITSSVTKITTGLPLYVTHLPPMNTEASKTNVKNASIATTTIHQTFI
jgi:hypothetical protein